MKSFVALASGVVFGAGSVARDRDQGTLEAELSMPVPMWLHGLARWLASSLLLSAFFVLAVGIFDSLLGLESATRLILHGSAACAGATAIGLVVMTLVAIPVVAEISPNSEVTWGVYGLDSSTETDAIASQVWAIEQIGDTIYVGGKFLEARQNSSSTRSSAVPGTSGRPPASVSTRDLSSSFSSWL